MGLFCLAILLSSCAPEPIPALNKDDKLIIDSLFQDYVKVAKSERDSICDLKFDANVAAAIDSIMQERKKEKEDYMDRIRKLQESL